MQSSELKGLRIILSADTLTTDYSVSNLNHCRAKYPVTDFVSL